VTRATFPSGAAMMRFSFSSGLSPLPGTCAAAGRAAGPGWMKRWRCGPLARRVIRKCRGV
jgi:hypothetical protein